MALIDPRQFVADPDINFFVQDFRSDLLATDLLQVSDGRYVIASFRAPKKQVYIIKAIIPYAMERTNIGSANASFQMLTPAAANGFFAFEPVVNANAAGQFVTNYNRPSLASVPQNNERSITKAISYVSDNPYLDANLAWQNPMFSVKVSSEAQFQVYFSLLPASTTSPIPAGGLYAIAAGAQKRVDFAGVVIAGVYMSEQVYSSLEGQMRAGDQQVRDSLRTTSRAGGAADPIKVG